MPFESRLDDDDGDENWEDSACSQVLNLAEEVRTSGGEAVDLEDLYEMNWYGEVARSASQTKSWLCNSGRWVLCSHCLQKGSQPWHRASRLEQHLHSESFGLGECDEVFDFAAFHLASPCRAFAYFTSRQGEIEEEGVEAILDYTCGFDEAEEVLTVLRPRLAAIHRQLYLTRKDAQRLRCSYPVLCDNGTCLPLSLYERLFVEHHGNEDLVICDLYCHQAYANERLAAEVRLEGLVAAEEVNDEELWQ